MTVIVSGHANRADDQKTFVPIGTKLRFYSDVDMNVNANVTLTAIADGAKATAQETVDGTGEEDDVYNYTFYTEDDHFVAQWLAMGGESGIPIHFVGDSLISRDDRLCNAPDKCDRTHTCDGVLGALKEEKDIVILACRGFVPHEEEVVEIHITGPGKDDYVEVTSLIMEKPESESKYGQDRADPLQAVGSEVDAAVRKILSLAKTDPDAAERQVDKLPQGTIAMMSNSRNFDSWQKARYLKDTAQSRDFEQMIGHLTANEDDLKWIMKWLDDIPAYGAAVDQAVTTNLLAIIPLTGMDLGALRSRDAIASAADAIEEVLDSYPQPDDNALAELAERNAANVKALPVGTTTAVSVGGGVALLGEGHDVRVRVYVYQAEDEENGTFQVKGSAFKSLEVEGIQQNQALVRKTVEAFSKMKVNFGE
jgi:hypothetical protein